MADLPELNEWTPGIRQLETSDPVLGGPDGIDNLQGKQLANRTRWLKDQIQKIVDGVTTIGKAAQLANSRTLRFKGAATGSGTYDGSTDTEIALTLVDSGLAPGSYTRVTLNSKGLAVGGSSPTTLGGYGITDGFASPIASTDFNNLVKSGLYQLGSGSTENRPAAFSGSVAFHQEYGAHACTLATDLATDKIAFRRREPGGFGQWRELWHTGNFNPDNKADKATTLDGYGITDGATKTELNGKASKATTLGGYGITDGATKTELNGKADKADTLAGYGIAPASQAEAEAGTDTNKPMTALRVFQAITAKVVQATGSVMGLARIASQVEVNAGADDSTIVTPKKLRLGVQYLIAANGYIIFPVWLGGLIIQWGSISVAPVSTGLFGLPIPFPNSFFGAVCQSNTLGMGTTPTYSTGFGIRPYGLGAAEIQNNYSGSNLTFFYIAIGK